MTISVPKKIPTALRDPATGEDRAGQAAPARWYLWLGTPPLVTLIITLWGITGSSYWRDEAATLVAVQRPFGGLLRLLGSVDVEHGAYYIMMWLVVRAGGTGELVTRLPAALAMAAAAALVAAIGARAVSPRAGLAAGLVFAVMPATSLYAQNARPDALSVAAAAGATYCLVRVMQDGVSSRRWLGGYAAAIVALGYIDILGLLLVAAHAVTVTVAALREKNGGARRALVRGWLLAIAAAAVLVSPLAWLSYEERGAVAWIRVPDASTLRHLAGLVAPMPQAHTVGNAFALGLLVVIALGLLTSLVFNRAEAAKHWPPDVAAICLPWLILPAVILLAISPFLSIFNIRYILFCVPALALLAGTALAALGRAAGAVALIVVTLLGLPAQLAARRPYGHGENIRLADRILAAAVHPGDAAIISNPTEENWSFAYPYGLSQLTDITQRQTPAGSGTLTGTIASPAAIQHRLSTLPRVWVIDLKYRFEGRAPTLHDPGFRLLRRWRAGDIWLFLYTRTPRG